MISLPAHLEVRFLAETAAHDDAIDELCAEAFGPGRFAKAASRVREMAPHARELSFVALRDRTVVGSVRQTRVLVGATPAVMLGPLAVRPACKGKGAGRALMAMAADAARQAGERAIFLVGDPGYYGPLGYVPLPVGSLTMPGPVDPRRIQALALVAGGLEGLTGAVGPRTEPR